LKPTYGAFSRYGLIPLCNSLDVPGIFTRSIEDAALVFNVLKGTDLNDSTTISQNISDVHLQKEEDLDQFVVGIPKEHYIDGTVPKIKEMWDKAIEQFVSAGAKIVEVSLPLHSRFKTLSDLGSGREGEHSDLTGVPEMDYHVTAINLAGVPAVSVPTGMSRDMHGNMMPVGMQVVGWKMQEAKVLRAAKVLEQESNFQYYTDKIF